LRLVQQLHGLLQILLPVQEAQINELLLELKSLLCNLLLFLLYLSESKELLYRRLRLTS